MLLGCLVKKPVDTDRTDSVDRGRGEGGGTVSPKKWDNFKDSTRYLRLGYDLDLHRTLDFESCELRVHELPCACGLWSGA